jgi:LysR family transcriptional activator of glutamate synthase operon
VTVEELEWFVSLAETEHMTAAAARLSITQPTLSRSLSRLERQVGAPLFDRVNRRVRLNRFGQIYLEHTRRSLAELEAAGERIAALRDSHSGTVRLAFLHSVAIWLTPMLLKSYRPVAPDVRFDLTQAPAHELLDLVRGGHVDLAITGPRPGGGDLRWHALHREQLCLAVPSDHRLAVRTDIALTDAADEPFVALGSPFELRRLTDELCSRAGISPRITFESAEIGSMEGLVAAGLGVAVVPAPRPHRAEEGVTYIPLADRAAHRTIGLVWPSREPQPPVVARFARFVTGTG